MFTVDEYKERAERAKKLMVRDNLDAIMVTGDFSGSDNYRYFSGHQPRDYQQNYGRPHIMILTADGRAGLVTLQGTASSAKEASWVDDVRYYVQPFTIEPVLELLKDLNLESARIGCELGAEQRLMMPIAEFLKMKETFSDADFTDATKFLWELRMVKSRAEADAVKQACAINGRALSTVLGNLSEGMSEADAVDSIITEIIKGGANRPPFAQFQSLSSPKIRSGKGFSARRMGPSKEPLLKGDALFVDSGCIYDGYWGEFCRMAVIGEPSKEQLYAHKVVREIVQRTVSEFIRPGVTSDEVTRYSIKLFDEYGIDQSEYQSMLEYPYDHIGHSVGITASEPPLLQLHNPQVIQQGMCLAVEVGFELDNFMYSSEENIWVTENGAEFLTDVDTELFVGKTK